MAQTIFYSNLLRVAAFVDSEGPRLQFSTDYAELDVSAVESLILALDNWRRDIKLIGICQECNVRSPLHRLGCRQAPFQQY